MYCPDGCMAKHGLLSMSGGCLKLYNEINETACAPVCKAVRLPANMFDRSVKCAPVCKAARGYIAVQVSMSSKTL